MSPEDILEAIKMSVKVNMTHIDKVVVVCSGRMEQAHTESINKLLQWLNFTKNRDKFVFIYNKSDLMSLLGLHPLNIGFSVGNDGFGLSL